MQKSIPPGEPAVPSYPIASVDNALRLLLLFKEQSTVRLIDACQYLGVAHSTGHRLLAMLAFPGFARKDPASRAEFDETAHLAMLEGNEVRYLDAVESTRTLRVTPRTGALVPAHCTSVGKALLAVLSRADLHALYPEPDKLPLRTSRSIATQR